MQALNPVLVLGMIPLFYQVFYPFCEKRGWSLKPIRRMWLGIALSAVAFVLSALVQILVDTRASPITILWQVPQYILVTAGEILFSITGLEFAYSQAPESMKSVVQAVWLFSVAGGKRRCSQAFNSLVGTIHWKPKATDSLGFLRRTSLAKIRKCCVLRP